MFSGNTPKYGLIFHSSFIGRAGAKHKGRISRYLANKCSMASRIDSFSDVPENGAGISNVYGTKLKAQVEERLEFYKTGAAPRKNIDVMHEAMKEAGDDGVGGDVKKSDKKNKKDKKAKKEVKEEPASTSTAAPMEEDAPAEKKAKKDKKRKAEEEEPAAEEEASVKKEKKKEEKKVRTTTTHLATSAASEASLSSFAVLTFHCAVCALLCARQAKKAKKEASE